MKSLQFKSHHLILGQAVLLAAGLVANGPARAATAYQTTFDDLASGEIEPAPGAPGQDGWFNANAPGSAYSEIQAGVAAGGLALHLFAPAANPTGAQTIAQRNLTPPDLGALPLVTLSFDFRAHSSDVAAVNNFIASLGAQGGPHPGYEMVRVGIGAGNGTAKSTTGVSLTLARFNGLDNNESVPLTVGQGLAWNTWHHVTVTIDQAADRYVSLTVDGAVQALRGFQLPRSDDGGVWKRGTLMEALAAAIIPDDVGGTSTDDDIYWDNVVLSASVALSSWPQRQRDAANTGRADFTVPVSRLNTNLFNAIRWQTPAPGSPADGSFGGSAMVFFDGAGPDGADLVAGGYHWPKGVQGMDRHTGSRFWSGLPDGGESIGENTPAFSTNGAAL